MAHDAVDGAFAEPGGQSGNFDGGLPKVAVLSSKLPSIPMLHDGRTLVPPAPELLGIDIDELQCSRWMCSIRSMVASSGTPPRWREKSKHQQSPHNRASRQLRSSGHPPHQIVVRQIKCKLLHYGSVSTAA
jgi:hypothetical protein